jgi:hypothetical protein
VTTYKDTAEDNSDLTAGGTFKFQPGAGQEATFWLNLVNNRIAGQAVGQNVTFSVYSNSAANSTVSVAYGTTNSVQVTGYSVAATAAASPACDVRVVLSDQEQTLTVQTIGSVASSTGTQGVSQVQVNTGVTGIFTCPINYKAVVLRGSVLHGANGQKVTITVQSYNIANPDVAPILYNLTKDASVTAQIGFEPSADVQLFGPVILLPGDALYGTTSSSTADASFEFLLIPL